ncbi:hypothetical protein B0H19DRAFT_1250302 [Mycena capillaripes]|nr:hypothetical protein B0H19DRAFT_1250302 [Mycena capillaripes]
MPSPFAFPPAHFSRCLPLEFSFLFFANSVDHRQSRPSFSHNGRPHPTNPCSNNPLADQTLYVENTRELPFVVGYTATGNIQRFNPSTGMVAIMQSTIVLTGGIVWVLSSQSQISSLWVLDVLAPFRRQRGLVHLPFAWVFSNLSSYPISWMWADVTHQTFTAVSVFHLWEATIFGIHESPIVVLWNRHSRSWAWHDGLSMRDLRLKLSNLMVK